MPFYGRQRDSSWGPWSISSCSNASTPPAARSPIFAMASRMSPRRSASVLIGGSRPRDTGVDRTFWLPTLRADGLSPFQVKANATTFSFWLLNEHANEMVSDTPHLRLRQHQERRNASRVLCRSERGRGGKMWVGMGDNTFYAFSRDDARPFQDKWDILRETK